MANFAGTCTSDNKGLLLLLLLNNGDIYLYYYLQLLGGKANKKNPVIGSKM